LVGEVEQDRAGFEKRERLSAGAVVVDDRRDPVVRADAQELRFELVALPYVDGMNAVLETGFLERDVNLVSVRGGPGIDVDHAVSPEAADGKASKYTGDRRARTLQRAQA